MHVRYVSLATLLLLGLCTVASCDSQTYEEERAQKEVERKQRVESRNRQLTDFAKQYGATPIFDLGMFGGYFSASRDWTIDLQDKIEGHKVAYRSKVLDVARGSADTYHLFLGNKYEGSMYSTLTMSKPIAEELLGIPLGKYDGAVSVVADIEKVEMISLEIGDNSHKLGDGYNLELDISTKFRPAYRVFGKVVALRSDYSDSLGP